MPATVADPNRSLDSEQISPATIAHHTVYEKTPNLHQSHICQWGAQPYLVGPLSRLVGKPPLSPWVSADFLPLTQVVNNTNSAIPLTEIFDRVFSDVCNSLGFEVQKQKKRGSGNNRVYRNLKRIPIILGQARCFKHVLTDNSRVREIRSTPQGEGLKKNQSAPRPSEHPPVMGDVYLTSTEPLRIQPWSQDRRNQTKLNGEHVRRKAGKADRRQRTRK